ncbi:unnamed protein product [marine sediment metagenome]|uniref:Uncharacterized protein n=1 Tax=marine sediment metagenome TaxID=412755 RepID=X1GKY6_9ZZZZ
MLEWIVKKYVGFLDWIVVGKGIWYLLFGLIIFGICFYFIVIG